MADLIDARTHRPYSYAVAEALAHPTIFDFPEDFDKEGLGITTCMFCNTIFYGQLCRVSCHVCSTHQEGIG